MIATTPWLLALALAAVTPSPSPSPTPPPVAETEALARRWDAFVSAQRTGDAAAQARALADLQKLRRVRNIPRLETASLALGAMAQQARAKGDTAGATALERGASELDPMSSRQQAESAPSAASLTRALPVIALVLALGLGLIFGVGLLVRYGPLFFHDLEERLGGLVGLPFTRLVTVLLLGFPVFFLQGFGFLPFWWAALLFGYLTISERAWMVAALLLGVLCVPGIDLVEGGVGSRESPLTRALGTAAEGIATPAQLRLIEEAARAQPGNRDLAVVLAVQERRAGRDDAARRIYENVLKTASGDAGVLNNLGNLAYGRGDYLGALARYDQALASASGDARAVILANKGLAHQQRFEFDKATTVTGQADALGSAYLASLSALYAGDANHPAVVLDIVPEERALTSKALDAEKPRALWRSLGNRFAAALALGTLTALVIHTLRSKARKPSRCQMCGVVFCGLCNMGKAAEGLCSQCHHLFAVRTGISAKAKAHKMAAVRSESRLRGHLYRVLSALGPGAGHVFAGKTSLGGVVAIVWTVGLTLYFLADRLLPAWNQAGPSGLGLASLVGIAAAALAWLWAQVFAPRRRETAAFRAATAAART